MSTTDYTYVDNVGNVRQYQTDVTTTAAGIAYTNTYQSSVIRMEGYREATTYATSTYFQPGSTTFTYDKNGYLTQVTDARQASNNRTLVNNASGQILVKQQNGLTERTALFLALSMTVSRLKAVCRIQQCHASSGWLVRSR
jgi:hypothetical protein